MRSKKDIPERKASQDTAQILSMYTIRVRKKSIGESATDLMQSGRWVHGWLKQYDEEGLDSLRALPQLDKPGAIPQETVSRIIGEIVPHI